MGQKKSASCRCLRHPVFDVAPALVVCSLPFYALPPATATSIATMAGENGHGIAVETTPLLATTDSDATRAEVPPKGRTTAAVVRANNDDDDGGGGNGNGDGDGGDAKPLPGLQIALLCYARLVEAHGLLLHIPVHQPVGAGETGGSHDADVGFYSGLIESLFSLTQAIVMIFWGRAADRYGRKPVLVFSLIGVTCATAVFGMAHTVWEMVLFRCLAGVFAGSIVTIRTMLAEHSTPATQARIFSWFAFTGNLGIFLGPLLGGALADPARQYGGVFRRVAFFADHPYALASFSVALLGATASVTTALFLQETLPAPGGRASPSPSANGNANGNSASKPPGPSVVELVRSPGVGIVLYVYAHVLLLAFAYTAIVPVWWFTPVPLGGFGFTPLQISLLLGLNGAAQAVWLLLVFPPLQHRIGTNGIM